MAWERSRQRIKEGRAEMRWGITTVPGCPSVEATLPESGMPLGLIWYTWENGGRIAINYIWVHEDLRRAGLATQMLDFLLTSYGAEIKEVTTGQVNGLSKPWCLKNGFVFNKARNYWSREIPAPKRKRTGTRS